MGWGPLARKLGEGEEILQEVEQLRELREDEHLPYLGRHDGESNRVRLDG